MPIWLLGIAVAQFVLQAMGWLLGPRRLRRAVSKALPWSAAILVVAIAWRIGLLSLIRLAITTTLGAGAFGLVLGGALGSLMTLILVQRTLRRADDRQPNLMTARGLLWQMVDGRPHPPPICPNCLQLMREETASADLRRWNCPECYRTFQWDLHDGQLPEALDTLAKEM